MQPDCIQQLAWRQEATTAKFCRKNASIFGCADNVAPGYKELAVSKSQEGGQDHGSATLTKGGSLLKKIISLLP